MRSRARREQKKFTLRQRRATFRSTKTLDQFDFERLPKLNRALVHDLATGRYLSERAPVLIVGQVGVGKSHLAQALGHCAIRQGIDVLFTPCAQLTASFNTARAAGAYERKLATLARIPLLIIDDSALNLCVTRRRGSSRSHHRTLRAGCHYRHQQPRFPRMEPSAPQQSAACLSNRRSPAPQRLLPRA